MQLRGLFVCICIFNQIWKFTVMPKTKFHKILFDRNIDRNKLAWPMPMAWIKVLVFILQKHMYCMEQVWSNKYLFIFHFWEWKSTWSITLGLALGVLCYAFYYLFKVSANSGYLASTIVVSSLLPTMTGSIRKLDWKDQSNSSSKGVKKIKCPTRGQLVQPLGQKIKFDTPPNN